MIMGIQEPAWLEALHTQRFFEGCLVHENAKKNEKNICCLDCCASICPHCIPAHRFHSLLQIRRYVYHDVVQLDDLEKLIDCSKVQAYTINGAKVVFIKKRPQNRQFKGSGNSCTSCERTLQEPYLHCSLGCKVDFMLKHYKDISPYLRPYDTLQLGPDFLIPQDMEDDDTPIETPRSTIFMDRDEQISWSSDSSQSENTRIFSDSSRSEKTRVFCAQIVRKKRSGLYLSEDLVTSIMSRRKGIPRRSPLC